MKFWKKTACLALCATMSFGVFAACGETGDNSGNNNGNGGDSEQVRREQARAAAKTYVDTVSDTLESAKSFKVSGTVVVNVKNETFGEDGKTVDSALTEKNAITLYLDVALTQDGEDDVAMEMTAKSEQVEIEVGETEITYQKVIEVKVKDGFAYGREYMTSSDMTELELEAAKGKWDKEEITMPEEMPPIDAAFVNQLLNAKELKEFGAQILGGAQEIIAEKFFNGEVANGKVAWSNNFAADINAVITYLESLDESKNTLGDIVDHVLAEIDEGLTVKGILDTVKAYKDKTVAEAFTEIDAELAKKNTSLQGIYDAIVNAEVVGIILAHPAIGMPAENLAQMKAFKLDAIKTEYGTMKLGDVFNMIVEMVNGAGGENSVAPVSEGADDSLTGDTAPVDSFAEIIAMVEGTLGMTLQQLEIELPDCSAFKMNDLSVDTGLKLNAAGDGLEDLYLSLDVGVQHGTYKVDDTKTDEVARVLVGYQYIEVSADLKISSFSTSTVTINAPAENEIESEVDGGVENGTENLS